MHPGIGRKQMRCMNSRGSCKMPPSSIFGVKILLMVILVVAVVLVNSLQMLMNSLSALSLELSCPSHLRSPVDGTSQARECHLVRAHGGHPIVRIRFVRFARPSHVIFMARRSPVFHARVACVHGSRGVSFRRDRTIHAENPTDESRACPGRKR